MGKFFNIPSGGRKKKSKNKSANMELTFRILGVTGNVFDTILQILLVAAIVYACYKGAQTAYSYGYRVFTEKPVAATVGNDVEITIPVDFNAKQLGEIFEGKGLSRDSKLLMLQYYCSEYRKNIKPGTYTLNTTMTAEEMFESIAQINIEKEEAAKKEAEKQQAEDEARNSEKELLDMGDESEEDIESGEGEEGSGLQQIDMDDELDNYMEDDVR